MLRVYLRLRNEAAGLVHREEGQTLTEYGPILLLIGIFMIVALGLLSDQIGALWSRITSGFVSAAS